MMLVPLLILAQGDPPNLDRKISLDVRGGTGKDVTNELRLKTGMYFEANDEAALDRFVVHVENAPVREVMERVAQAEAGEWIHLGDNAYRLRRSAARVGEVLAQQRAETIKNFQKALDGYRKQLAGKPDFSDETAQDLAQQWRRLGPQPTDGVDYSGYWEKQNALERSIPVGRAFMRVLLTFSATELADMSVDERTVCSTKPTAMQRPLSSSAFAALGDLVSEQVVWEDAVNKYLPNQAGEGWNGMATQGKIRNIATALISFERWDENSGIQAHLILADKKDKIITETYLYVQAPQESDRPAPKDKPKEKPEPNIILPDVDVSLAQMFTFNQWDAKAAKPEANAAARAIAADPEKVDPLATFVSDGLIGLAKQRHENLAAVIDDRAMQPIAYNIDKKGMNPKVLQMMSGWGQQSVEEANGWMILRERRPDRADEVRSDRLALHAMLASALANGRLSLDAAAAYALTSPRFDEDPVPQAYLTALLDKQGGRTLSENDKHLLRFYGSLDAAQRANAQHLSLASLTPFQTRLLEKMVYGNNGNLQQDYTEPPQPDENGEYPNMWNTLAREPSVSLGGGIPQNGYVTMTSVKNKAIIAHMQYGEWDQGQQTYDPQSLAWMIASRDLQQDGNNGWTVLGLRSADRTQISFDFKYTGKLSQNMSLQDVLPTMPETGFVEKLPADLRQELQKALDEAKKQYAQGNGVYYGGGWRSGGPPP